MSEGSVSSPSSTPDISKKASRSNNKIVASLFSVIPSLENDITKNELNLLEGDVEDVFSGEDFS